MKGNGKLVLLYDSIGSGVLEQRNVGWSRALGEETPDTHIRIEHWTNHIHCIAAPVILSLRKPGPR